MLFTKICYFDEISPQDGLTHATWSRVDQTLTSKRLLETDAVNV